MIYAAIEFQNCALVQTFLRQSLRFPKRAQLISIQIRSLGLAGVKTICQLVGRTKWENWDICTREPDARPVCCRKSAVKSCGVVCIRWSSFNLLLVFLCCSSEHSMGGVWRVDSTCIKNACLRHKFCFFFLAVKKLLAPKPNHRTYYGKESSYLIGTTTTTTVGQV